MIFLSASVPIESRRDEFSGPIDVLAIRDAIVAFTKVCVENELPFYFGGHPAITPLVYKVARQYTDVQPLIKIYQSSYFKGQTPKEVEFFDNICWTEIVNGNMKESVEAMRIKMFKDNPTECAVFIGGMKGIIDEVNKIRDIYPLVKILPIASTGGASFDLYHNMNLSDEELLKSLAYVSLFRDKLKDFFMSYGKKADY